MKLELRKRSERRIEGASAESKTAESTIGESGLFHGSSENFGLLGGDPDGEFGDPTVISADPTGDYSEFGEDFDPFPEDLPVWEG